MTLEKDTYWLLQVKRKRYEILFNICLSYYYYVVLSSSEQTQTFPTKFFLTSGPNFLYCPQFSLVQLTRNQFHVFTATLYYFIVTTVLLLIMGLKWWPGFQKLLEELKIFGIYRVNEITLDHLNIIQDLV